MIPILMAKAIAKKIPYQVYLLIGAGILFWLYGVWQYNKGQDETQKRWDLSVERGKVLVEQLEKNSLTVNMIVDTQFKTRVEYIQGATKTIVKEIPIYIPVDTPDLPAGFRVLHDAAALAEVPTTSGSIEAAPVPVRTAAETITLNYQQCHLWRSEVEAWRVWYQEQALLWQTDHSK